MKIIVSFVIATLAALPVPAQDAPPEEADALHRMSDNLPLFEEEDTQHEGVYENLVHALSSQYDLNSVSAEELKSLNILTDEQIANFITYRTEQGKFLDVHELQVVPGFDLEVIANLLPFVRITGAINGESSILQRIFSNGNGYIVSRYERTLERKKGFIPAQPGGPEFTGSEDKLYLRFRSAQPGHYSMGFTGEKDAGERMSWGPSQHRWGFDFTSWHVQLQRRGKLKNLVAGNFQTQFAQGLLLGGAFGLGKNAQSISSTRKSNLGFMPYTASNESAALNGIGVTVLLKPFEISAFFSRAHRDASAGKGADSLVATSFPSTGLHRTVAELNDRRKVSEQNCGLIVQAGNDNVDAGVIVNAVSFGLPVTPRPSRHNQFAFRGKENVNAGVFLNYRFQNVSFFGEAGQSFRAGGGAVMGLLISAHRNLDVSVVYRNYSRDFHTFYANAFAENTAPQNERGVYWSWQYRWRRLYNLTGYMDLFTFPWLAFRRYAPARGYEWLLKGSYHPSKAVSVFVQARMECKPRNLAEQSTLYRVGEGLRKNVAVHCDYGVGGKLRLKTRMQFSNYSLNGESTKGFALVQDVSVRAGAFEFTGRHALFDTDHYDNRQYVYERDAWLAYSLPAYSGTGVRNYALIEYKVHKQITIWARYARTRQLKAEEIGSGPDAVAGNTRNDVKFQVRFKF